ncbi:MAG: hypothetical protein A2857_05685 [Candidatus Levybacteria bacterium RIFCSPHIGHO2_01_FULL_36_15]|nr:MAG: hypothetical protein A2857_05685 [Candidatus Levybacteria bacterium RIFCSPHIGHO2_01_FULL_36_15]OGH38392.1 MAG: hypothetical protein A2905_00485 [Candidatus Levybacteria bacterium RIFCSPLOWO2_01_FULL_36_10]
MNTQKIAFVDVETTGARVNYDRIIEIGILRVEDNKIKKIFKSLINPQAFISPYIEEMTGIKKDDLENAPTFREIKNEILQILKDCIFVAHNVRFDYGFLKNEFKRLDISFSSQHFCTVKLSRELFPKFRRHDLDSIIRRFNISCKRRHRAYDDAKVLWEFIKIIEKRFSDKRLLKAFDTVLKKPSLPINISPKIIDSLPESSGMYVFYDEKGTPLYIGKSINVKERVLSHFSRDYSSSFEMSMCQEIKSIEVFETSGELGALFKESSLIKKMQPVYNRQLRLRRELIVLKKIKSESGYDSVLIEQVSNIKIEDLEDIMGVFKAKKQAKEFLVNIAREYSLCQKILNIEKTRSHCFGYHLGWCKGACMGDENPAFYNARFIMAFSKNKIKKWPFNNPVIIEEKDKLSNSEGEVFLIDKWCFLGSIKYDNSGRENSCCEKYDFDLDTYKILNRYLCEKRNLKNVKTMSKEKFTTLLKTIKEV